MIPLRKHERRAAERKILKWDLDCSPPLVGSSVVVVLAPLAWVGNGLRSSSSSLSWGATLSEFLELIPVVIKDCQIKVFYSAQNLIFEYWMGRNLKIISFQNKTFSGREQSKQISYAWKVWSDSAVELFIYSIMPKFGSLNTRCALASL